MPFGEAKNCLKGNKTASYYTDNLKESVEFKKEYATRPGVVACEDMPWEDSPQGRIKHLVHDKMNTKETGVDMYMQVIPPGGKSGKHAHMIEEMVFVLEGDGYDLHWDAEPDIEDKYYWKWQETPKKFEWSEQDVVYIPPYVAHQHVNTSKDKPCRIISATCKTLKDMGFNWFEQLENAPDYKVKK